VATPTCGSQGESDRRSWNLVRLTLRIRWIMLQIRRLLSEVRLVDRVDECLALLHKRGPTSIPHPGRSPSLSFPTASRCGAGSPASHGGGAKWACASVSRSEALTTNW
jgi:hypothetical protein